MESFLIPLVIVVVVVVLGLLVMKYLGSRSKAGNDGGARGRSSRGPAAVASREEAVRASAQLNQQQHSAIYSLLARGDALNAIMAYRRATGAKLRDAATAIASMSTYPQPHGAGNGPASAGSAGMDGAGAEGEPVPAPEAEQPGWQAQPVVPDTPEALAGPPVGPAAPQEPVEDQVPATTPQEPAAGYRYRAIVSHGDEIREIASTRLNDDVFAQVKGRALGGDRDGAVRLLVEHSEADEDQARDFVRLIQPEPPADDAKG